MAATSDGAHGRDPWMQVPCDVGEALRAGVPRARKRLIRAIRSEVAAYNQPLKGEVGQAVRGGVDGALNRFVEMIERHDADALGSSRSLFYDLGRRAFREGRGLDALLHAYRVGARVAWQEIVAACKEAGVEPDVAYQLAETVIEYINELSAASTEGFSAESAAAADVTQAARQELVELLTVQPSPDPGVLNGAVQRARYCLPPRIAALACGAGEPVELAARIGPGVIGARVAGLVCVLLPEPNEEDDQRLTEALNGTHGALGPSVSPDKVPQSWDWSRRTLELIDGGTIDQGGVVRVEQHLATIFLRGDESLGGELAARWLAPLERLSERSRQELPETLLAWLAHERNFAAAADDLNLHPHTVRYRLRRLRELYGGALDDPDARFELELALRTTGLRVRHSPRRPPKSIRN